jgi:CheY-specific phosphatase CheX
MFFAQTLGESSVPEPAENAPAGEIAVRIVFHGEPAGSMTLRLTSAAARQIAADFLGLDEAEVTGLQTSQVVCELGNMICGSLLSRVESATAFQLDAPQAVPPSEALTGDSANVRLAVDLSNGRLILNVATETPPCLEPVQSAY